MTTYRNPKLLALAKHAPRCFCCGADNDGTVVAAHSNEMAYGKGMGHKAHDWAISYVCHKCHERIDGRADKLSRNDKELLWRMSHIKTIEWLFSSGSLVTK